MTVQESDNYCIMCGTIIPEGRQICPICEKDKFIRSKWQNAITNDELKQIRTAVKNCISQATSDGFTVSEINQALHECIDSITKEEEE